MSDGVSIRAFGRQVGRSHTWVSNQIKAGLLPQNADGTIPLKRGLLAARDLCKELAADAEVREGAAKKENAIERFNRARAEKEDYLAQIKKIELEVLKSDYVHVSDVKKDARETASKFRQFCVAAPTRYAGLLENVTQRQAEAVLQDLFIELLENVHSGKFFAEGGDDGAVA